MLMTDILVTAAEASFSEEKYRVPFKLSSGVSSQVTYAKVEVTVVNRRGETATGVGGILLSTLWTFPTPAVSREVKDRLMRELVERFRSLLLDVGEYLDPLQLSHAVSEQMRAELKRIRQAHELNVDIPLLSALVAWSPFDAAIHDAWGRTIGESAFRMYSRNFLNEDLGHYLGDSMNRLYPDQFLGSPKANLWVQHTLGASDPLTDEDKRQGDYPEDGIPVTLADWMERDRLRWLKVKIQGKDVQWDLQRILDVYRVATECVGKLGIRQPIQYEIDSNEGHASAEPVVELLRRLKETDEEAFAALKYVEQPTARNLTEYSYTMHDVSRLKPVLLDESMEDLGSLQQIDRLGWSGIALKSCKGQSDSLLTYCWARSKGLFLTVQDLTNPGLALVHSANLTAHLKLSCNGFEYNSRQYIPFSRPEEQAPFRKLFDVRDGRISLSQIRDVGLY
jgi:L-alanine-DL-glutamate epimerase-like enolase superfamily enzyme